MFAQYQQEMIKPCLSKEDQDVSHRDGTGIIVSTY